MERGQVGAAWGGGGDIGVKAVSQHGVCGGAMVVGQIIGEIIGGLDNKRPR